MKIAKQITTAVFAGVVALTAAGCASTEDRVSTGQYIDDAVITAKVKSSFAADPSVKATEINVETYKGAVQLSGFVAEPRDAMRAAEIARGVEGVTSVKNDIRVK